MTSGAFLRKYFPYCDQEIIVKIAHVLLSGLLQRHLHYFWRGWGAGAGGGAGKQT